MLKTWDPWISTSLEMIFPSKYWGWCFFFWMEKGIIVPIDIKGEKQTLKNYCLVSLLPVCEKIFKGLLFNKMFQTGNIFKPCDSYINLTVTNYSQDM